MNNPFSQTLRNFLMLAHELRVRVEVREKPILPLAMGHTVPEISMWHDRYGDIDRQSSGMVRYCPRCSYIGNPSLETQTCCPEHHHAVYVPEEIAYQARKGYHTSFP